ncbi:MAG: response regulator, partial [Solirubrobacteraceae bacterium]|nr:response regulator [Solirubrobacteraceae bacterium]
DGRISLMNRQAEVLFGYGRDELVGMAVEQLVPMRFEPGHAARRDGYFADPKTRPMGAGAALAGRRKDGSEFPAEISLSSLETETGTIAVAAVRDISERAESERERALQQELHQARRLESVGQLAGGIAHDFNNLLGVILNLTEFVVEAVPPGSQAHQDLEEIGRAAERAADLTRQLLIFSRRELVQPEILDLNALTQDLETLLRRALGERVELEVVLTPGLWRVRADRGQVEQVLVNLAVNGRDAMPGGGRLVIETSNVELDEDFTAGHLGLEPGPYVRVTVSDEGVGMAADVVERAFEPFFTTKQKGHGTGLGLATVYGIVQEAGGHVTLYSEPGVGTSVKVHLPGTELPTSDAAEPERTGAPAGRGETVLVVEDEPEVRRIAERILSRSGYTVLSAAGGEEALAIAATEQIDLVLTDVIMPGMVGPDLVERLRVSDPGLRVIYMSGYSHKVLEGEELGSSPRTAFVEKPFPTNTLRQVVRNLLDVESSSADA